MSEFNQMFRNQLSFLHAQFSNYMLDSVLPVVPSQVEHFLHHQMFTLSSFILVCQYTWDDGSFESEFFSDLIYSLDDHLCKPSRLITCNRLLISSFIEKINVLNQSQKEDS